MCVCERERVCVRMCMLCCVRVILYRFRGDDKFQEGRILSLGECVRVCERECVCACAYVRVVLCASDTLSVSGCTISFMRVFASRLVSVCFMPRKDVL